VTPCVFPWLLADDVDWPPCALLVEYPPNAVWDCVAAAVPFAIWVWVAVEIAADEACAEDAACEALSALGPLAIGLGTEGTPLATTVEEMVRIKATVRHFILCPSVVVNT
jgi:hypothetical protein